MKVIITVLLIGLAGYAAVCGLLYFQQDGLIFFPTQARETELLARAAAIGFKPWHASDGAWIGWEPEKSAKGDILVVFHGNAGMALDRSWLTVLGTGIRGAQWKLCLFEYPGYGARDGTPSEKSMTAAAIAAVDSLTSGPSQRIWILGESLGSGVAAAVAGARPEKVSGVILVTPFDSLASAASAHYPWLPVNLLIRHRFDSMEKLRNYHGPVAFVIAANDSTIPPRHARTLAEGYAGTKKVWEIAGAEHNDGSELLGDWAGLSNFLLESDRTGHVVITR